MNTFESKTNSTSFSTNELATNISPARDFQSLDSSVHDLGPDISRKDDFLVKRAYLEAHIDELASVGGGTNPWLSNAYLELGSVLVGEAASSRNNKGLLHEAEGFLLNAYEVATVNGDTTKRIRSLEELALVAGMLGDSQLSGVLSNQAEALYILNEHLDQVPLAERLRYQRPAAPFSLSREERIGLKGELSTVLSEKLPSSLSEYEVSAVSDTFLKQLREAASESRWIDDLLMLEISESVSQQVKLGVSLQETTAALKFGLPVVSNYKEEIDLGLHEKSLTQFSVA